MPGTMCQVFSQRSYARARNGAVHSDFIYLGPFGAQPNRQRWSRNVGARQEHALPGHITNFRQNAFSHIFTWHEIGPNAMVLKRARRGWPNCADTQPAQRCEGRAKRRHPLEKRRHAIHTGDNQPGVAGQLRNRRIERAVVVGRCDGNRRAHQRRGPERAQLRNQLV